MASSELFRREGVKHPDVRKICSGLLSPTVSGKESSKGGPRGRMEEGE